MKELETIKKSYKPIQPTVNPDNGIITYQEVKPEKKLENFVYCFWQLKSRKTLNHPFLYRVVSDGCIDIFFNHSEPSENFVMGFCNRYTEFPIGNTFDYIGIRFLPSAFPLLFGIDAKTLSNQSQKLEYILPKLSAWIKSETKPLISFERLTKKLNKKLTDIAINKDLQYDQRFFNALNTIFQKHGYINTEKDLNTGVSARQLQRFFNFYIGTTAKRFSNVVRFQYILNAKPSKQNLKGNKLYFDVGFYDQAHFIKHFKTFYGVTPSEAFR